MSFQHVRRDRARSRRVRSRVQQHWQYKDVRTVRKKLVCLLDSLQGGRNSRAHASHMSLWCSLQVQQPSTGAGAFELARCGLVPET